MRNLRFGCPTGFRSLVTGKMEKVLALGTIELQRFSECGEHLARCPYVAPLFEPRVPGHSDAGQQSDLLPPQAWRAPAETPVQTDILRR